MRILIAADGRSPITRRWVQGVLTLGHQVSLVSTYPCQPLPGVNDLFILPVAFSAAAAGTQQAGGSPRASAGGLKSLVKRFRPVFLAARGWLGPLTLPIFGRKFARIVQQVQPDLVHAMRIPYEGMLASHTPPGVPLIVSTWGNDLTLHARSSAALRRWTERALRRADGLIADAQRDIRIAPQFGFDPDRPAINVLTSGGIDLTEIARLRSAADEDLPEGIPAGVPLVINPRGIRPAYAQTDIFFQAIPLVLQRWPDVFFLCPAMADQKEALYWVNKLKLNQRVLLMPALSQHQLWETFLRCDISVSLTIHDGTPNTLLEAMSCGCLPIAGDIESLREWITPGVNGLLADPHKPQSLANALLLALENPALRQQAAEHNFALIQRRADVNLLRAQVEVFYQRVAGPK